MSKEIKSTNPASNEEYRVAINELLNKTEDKSLLDLVLKLLQKSQ